MRKLCSTVVKVAVGAMVFVALMFLVGMRRKSPLVQDRVRRFNKKVGNPKQMRTRWATGRLDVGGAPRRAGLRYGVDPGRGPRHR